MPAPPISGSLIQLSGPAAGNQSTIDLAALPNGRFVAVWRDATTGSIAVKFLTAAGTAPVTYFYPASGGTAYQNNISIGVLPDGQIVVAYEDSGNVKMFSMTLAGAFIGANVTVATGASTPMVNVNPVTGNFSVAYTDSASNDVKGKSYDAALNIVDSDIAYSYTNTTTDRFPGGASFDNGVQATAYKADAELRMTLVSSNYTVYETGEITVSTNITGFIDLQPMLALLSDGNMLVTWTNSSNVVQGRIYNSSGTAVTAAFDISTAGGYLSGVTALKNGGFMVTWTDSATFSNDVGRIFDANYQPVDVPFTLMDGAGAASQERRPVVTELADGRIVVGALVINSNGDYDTVAQIYDPRIGGLYTSASSFADDWRGTTYADTVFFAAGNDMMFAGGGNDTIYGEGGADTIYGEGGNDDLLGGGGIDDLLGGANNDNLYGELGNDNLYGESGEDYLSGGAGDDYLSGGTERDNFIGGAGRDTLIGGQGDDQFFIYTLDDVNDVIVEYVGEGNDRVFAAVNYSLAADSEVETISTTSNAGTTAVTLNGSSKNNTIIGNNGVNSLNGMGGNDILYGLGGVDYFWFTTAPNGATNADTIIGFSTVDDFIFLDDAIYTGIAAGALNGAAFLSGAGAINSTLAAHRIIHNTTTGDLFWDPDGVGGANATRFATIGAGTAIAAGDIYLV
jgi:Ca2+-binding RTX toxin-like protein